MSLIELENVGKSFLFDGVNKSIIEGVNLSVSRGSIVAIIGPSGSGKSTLLNIIGGLDSNFEGETVVDGIKLKNLSDRELSRFRNEKIGFIFQHFNLLDHLNCRENVALPSYFAGSELKDTEKRIDYLFEKVQLTHRMNQYPPTLSGGEKQRVAIARALVMKPSVLLCDEPTGDLDDATAGAILDLFLSIRKEMNVTFVMVTHEERITRIADEIYAIRERRLVRV
ncbi:MAG: ABC transporter ATP-binding protein [Deltaproteobacteria bacterium]|nr:ABC transporter ATP-binding protein [Deltaproteobacteria bacterium]